MIRVGPIGVISRPFQPEASNLSKNLIDLEPTENRSLQIARAKAIRWQSTGGTLDPVASGLIRAAIFRWGLFRDRDGVL